jgi:sugar/nucleoside kinase (ribokinase family)
VSDRCSRTANEAFCTQGARRRVFVPPIWTSKGNAREGLELGERGAYIQPADGPGEYVQSHSVRTIDSTGAGDAFIAGVLAAWHRKLDWRDAGRIANAAGALATTKQGATEGIETWEQAVAKAEVRSKK